MTREVYARTLSERAEIPTLVRNGFEAAFLPEEIRAVHVAAVDEVATGYP